jgi:hypothetical protein
MAGIPEVYIFCQVSFRHLEEKTLKKCRKTLRIL